MDDYRNKYSDYEPNFVLKDILQQDDQQEAAQTAEPSQDKAYNPEPQQAYRNKASYQSSYAGQTETDASHGCAHQAETDASQQTYGTYRDPRDNFRRRSASASCTYSAGDSSAGYTYRNHESGTSYDTSSGDADTASSSYGYSGSWDSRNGMGKMKKPKQPKKSSDPVTFTRKTLALFIALCVVVSGVFGIGGAAVGSALFDGQDSTASSTAKPGSATAAGYTLEDATGSNLTVQEITDMAKSSVVEITTESVLSDSWMQQYVTQGAGSGVIITSDGYIVTNNHVIEGASKIAVTTADGKDYEATLVGSDSVSDVAVLKIDADNLAAATYGNSDQLAVGDLAVAIGNPLGELGGTVTAGIISALDRQLSIDGKTMTLLQTDSSINPGNSGGGLFNGDGQLIGIVVAKSSGSDVEGLGFAIPINTAADVAQQIMDKGYVSGQPSTGMTYTEAGGSQGGMDMFFGGESSVNVYIYSVDGENAKKAGFQEGDMVYAVDGQEITSFNDLSSIVTSHKVGDKLKFTIIRDGSEMDITLQLEEKTHQQ